MGNVSGSASSRSGVERPPEFPNYDEQLLAEEDEVERGFLGRV